MRRINAVLIFRIMLVLNGLLPAYYICSPFDLTAESALANENYYGYNSDQYFESLLGDPKSIAEELIENPDLLAISIMVLVVWLFITVISTYYVLLLLMWCFSPRGRFLYVLWNVVVGGLALAVAHLVVQHPVDQVIGYLAAVSQGALIAMAYGEGLAWRFGRRASVAGPAGQGDNVTPGALDRLRGTATAAT